MFLNSSLFSASNNTYSVNKKLYLIINHGKIKFARKKTQMERKDLKVVKSILVIILIVALFGAAYLIFFKSQGPSSSETHSKTIIINEYMASNSSFLPDDKGQYSDWIEIYNPTDSDVDLSGYGLSIDKKAAEWTFPGLKLQTKGYMVVFASGDGKSDANVADQHTNFKLSADKGGIFLFNSSGELIESEEYNTRQASNVSVGRDPGDQSKWNKYDKATPGFENNDAGYAAFQKSRHAENPELIITEVMPSNKTTIADNNGNYNDYIEIYNKSDKAVDLTGYGLSDDTSKVLKWKFPSVSIQPKAYLVVFASGEDAKSTDLKKGAIHTNFKISAYKGTLVLSDNKGYILDQMTTSETAADSAYARVMDNSGAYSDKWNQTNKTSPGFPNNDQGNSDFKNSKTK